MPLDVLAVPRRSLTSLPTPLLPAPRFSHAVGHEVLIKRDDVGSLAMAGNKVRKLELIGAKADADGIEVLVIVGAAQSNAARAVAAFAAATGRRCVIVIPSRAPEQEPPEGNLLLSLLFGAELRYVGGLSWADAERAAEAVCAALNAAGVTALALPTGCSSPLGTLAFTLAYRELLDQLAEQGVKPSCVIHASSSGGTSAGLHLGRVLFDGPPVLSVDVGRLFDDVERHIATLATETAQLAGHPATLQPADINLTFDYVGAGYAEPTSTGLDAIRLLAACEGILCDPVYSGKALAAVRDYAARSGLHGPLVFWHTGGAQSVLTRTASQQLLPAGSET